ATKAQTLAALLAKISEGTLEPAAELDLSVPSAVVLR
ncbi:MAG: cell division protein FtsQ, partial [Blastococcus sp.]|nr:cell division protein FtsQ [Blastococcus sp.]